MDYNLDALETKNQIMRKSGKSRAIELVNRPRRGNSEFVPMLGTIAAGMGLALAGIGAIVTVCCQLAWRCILRV